MSTAIQLLEPDKGRSDMFFDRVPVVTDWDAIRQQIADGVITRVTALERVKSYEPLKEADPREHAHWVDQQVLRMVLRHEAKKPLDSNLTCESCGSRKVDPINAEHDWHQVCLYCAERDRQSFSEKSRGSMEFLRPSYNPRSHSWGLLYYYSSQDHTFIFWLADFYKNRREAEMALSPIHHYHQWLAIKHNDMIAHSLSFSDLLSIDEIMKLNLPLTPEKFREHLRSVIETDMQSEQQVMSYYVRDAMGDHERAEDDE